MGIVVVAVLAAKAEGVAAVAAITATFRRTSSAASAVSRSNRPSAQRYSIATFSPSTWPVSLRPCRNAPRRSARVSDDVGWRNPITGIAGCARADIGHAAAVPPSSVMNSRRFHSITSSARASSIGGTSRPSVLAVLRLMTNSNLVGCSTGRSAGFTPRRILST